jgi:branched-chain amino acid transport system ATP-binding protein
LTVAENLAVACSGRRVRDNSVLDLVADLFPVVLKEKRKQMVSRLSGGQRQMVALALAMVRQPKVLLLDEPSLGLAPVVVEQMMDAVKTTATNLGTGVLVVEQDIPAALAVADRVHIMKQGSLVLSAKAVDFPSAEALWEYF